MTDHSPGAPLGSWLADMSDEQLLRLLQLRPDLTGPPPATLTVDWMPRIAGRLAALRAERGLNQASMGELLGISTSYLSQLEHDDRPLTPVLIERLSRQFPLDWREIGAGVSETRLAALASLMKLL